MTEANTSKEKTNFFIVSFTELYLIRDGISMKVTNFESSICSLCEYEKSIFFRNVS